MSIKPRSSNKDVATSATAGKALPVEDTTTTSDPNTAAKEPLVGDTGDADQSGGDGGQTATAQANEPEATQLKSPETEDGTHAYAPNEDNGDDADTETEIDTGAGVVVGDGATVQSYVPRSGDPASAPIGGDGVTGVTQDGDTYASRDGATGDTSTFAPSTGTTPSAPTPTTADALVSALGQVPARVEAAVNEVIDTFKQGDKPITATSNLFDDLGLSRADLTTFAFALNEKFGTTLTVGEAQNFLRVKDVYSMMKRKLAVANATA